ncbi:MAG: S-methyl-5-thioribose-1-phosphate isomerase [Candidatus Omnitrophica bacterium CG1_02_44_16]|nr:MAG: S-methyl-5-thioribose-1-phosphate isomerase [Candidatus Omnitrophica bacterium CG1_02_44_16]PIY83104.1 MAG: S-methyl-5-thioribose-1-phosphate isomerase [Candidatus Omnitrophica bacterium CG_4_10_14_0_8_um_filter_44_12]PIZ84268.1 MAG: S-methyl-5-thioribose-1-phosphate isomerase [Candidatus Omnitrophica bacterium CG_4_10_14_0_2_um_filter_44_9]
MEQKLFVKPIAWHNGAIRLIDQTRLPAALKYEECRRVSDVWRAIKKLKVRGAPLIGIAGALGFFLGMRKAKAKDLFKEAKKLNRYLASSRPTAINLSWALNMMQAIVETHQGASKKNILGLLKTEVERLIYEDTQMCFKMSEFGSRLIKPRDSLMTVCNAGGLATSGYGTALGVFYRAREKGKMIKVYACETRPLLQGARLTTWELKRNGIDVTLICDDMAADVMRKGKVNAVFVGADRIAANGDFANKIGTYGLAVLARYHKIPFYCVAPFSTFDLSLSTGADIPIEERDKKEVTALYFKRPIAPEGIKVFNPAFDVTPANLITAIITEKGIIKKPFYESIKALYPAA